MRVKSCLLLISLMASFGIVWAGNAAPIGTPWVKVNSNSDIPYSPANDAWGSETYPYEISNAAELKKLADIVNGSTPYAVHTFAGFYFKLTNSIDLGNYLSWIPIGRYKNDASLSFSGTFDGDGYLINNININTYNLDNRYGYSGLFGLITWGVIKNLGIQGTINVTSTVSNMRVGLLAGCNEAALIENCYAKGNINYTSSRNEQFIGLLVGYNTNRGSSPAIIRNCYAMGDIAYSGSGTSSVGGLVGDNASSIIENCYTIGNVNAPASSRKGSFVGRSRNSGSNINNCYAHGNGCGSWDNNGTLDIRNINNIYNNRLSGLPGSAWIPETDTYPSLVSMNRNTYTIIFSAGSGGDFVSGIASISAVPFRKPVSGLPDAQRAGYGFYGWRFGSTPVQQGDSWATIFGNLIPQNGSTIILTAQWGPSTGNETLNSNVKIGTTVGTIIIETSTVTTVQVVSLSGNIIFNKKVNGATTVNVPTGIYVVVADGKPTKIAVK